VRTGPDGGVGRGKGLPWVLAALGALLIVAGLVLPVVPLGSLGSFEPGREHAGLHDGGPSTGRFRQLGQPAQRGLRAVTPSAAHRVRFESARPVRLTIPSLGISAPVTPITVRSSVLTPPSDPQILGWWSGGAMPGSRHGTTIITGHTVHTGGGTFDSLHDLAKGDHIRVTTTRGPLDYQVTSVSDDSKNWLAAHARRVFSQTVAGRLALVTCTDWTGTTYLSNTVVLATPVAR
jgi:LPXTG-site transpeptidase (sortase) family protein